MRSSYPYVKFITLCTISLLLSSFIIPNLMANADNIIRRDIDEGISTAAQIFKIQSSLIPPPDNLNVRSYVLMDAKSGIIIAEKNMNLRLQPASLTKLMTLYITFQTLKTGKIRLLDDKATVSTNAWRTSGSRMFLKEGSHVPINSLIQGIVVASGNDACVTMAQYIAGSEETFAQMMNQVAQHLGMKNSHYVNSTGLPYPNHYSTAYDMALLTRALIKNFPEYYYFFSKKWLTYNNIRQPNHNRLLWRDISVDGLKTGYTKKAGYCLVASAQRKGMRLITVVFGAPTDNDRALASEILLNYGFHFYKTQRLFNAHTPIIRKRIWLGKCKYINFGTVDSLYITLPIENNKNLKATIQFLDPYLHAPIKKGQSYGIMSVTVNGNLVIKAPLMALQEDPISGLLSRVLDHIVLFLKKCLVKLL